MNKSKIIISASFFMALCIMAVVFIRLNNPETGISIEYPFNNALFPPEFPAPTFEWTSEKEGSSSWEIALYTDNNKYTINTSVDQPQWTPDESRWDSLKYISDYNDIYFTVNETHNRKQTERIVFKISKDTVGAPVLYRQMPIPSFFAEENLDSMNYMLVNFGSKEMPHVAMEGFQVCGNCHSFSDDGNTIALDLDAGKRDKGGYFISEIEDTIKFNFDNYRSWSKIQNRSTFGLFSKISPNGRYVATTVKDRVVFVNFKEDSLKGYSQLFFPVNGHLAIYDRQTGELKELPGANLPEYVQTNSFWTPDGENIVFSRANSLPPRNSNSYGPTVLSQQVVNRFIEREVQFKYDICIIPFNNGNGGKAEKIRGASNNGKSNYFPAVSPDGKWLMFCQAENYMLLMPDSRLYIVPLEGGRARKLDCNLSAMNSWHAWSPNSKWVVFASKGLSIYTDMFLTHIDDKGNASIPVLVEKAREKFRVINYPEFVDRIPEDKFVMNYDYVELAHLALALSEGETEKAKQLYYQLKDQDPYFLSKDYYELSDYLYRMGLTEDAKEYLDLARRMDREKMTSMQ
jgi:tetratricopeptide (TPR) repeat protein